MAKVRCVMMQRDESDLLEAWFRYYGYLFGFENLEVIDNGSVEPPVLHILARYEAVGSKVHRNFNQPMDFQNKGAIMGRINQEWDDTTDYDLALPLDCDEFLAYYDNGQIRCDRQGQHTYLDRFIAAKDAISINKFLFNAPDQPGWFHLRSIPKGFFSRGTIVELDHGFHFPRTATGRAIDTDLMHIHLHNRPFDRMKHYARQKLRHYVDVDDLEAVRQHQKECHHLVPYFFMRRDEYDSIYDDVPLIFCRSIVEMFRALGIDLGMTLHAPRDASVPIPPASRLAVRYPKMSGSTVSNFDAPYYLARLPDVAASGMNPLMHFNTYGHKEPRPITPAEMTSVETVG